MFKQLLTLCVMTALLLTVCANPIFAFPKEDEAKFTAKVKAKIAKLGTGSDAKIEIKLRDKTKLKGYISEINDDSFAITDSKTGAVTKVEYSQVKQVKGNNLSTGVKIAIGIGIGIGALILIALIAATKFGD
jgi:hypothetical protein